MKLEEFVTARLDEEEAEANDFHDARRCGSLDRDGGFDPQDCDCGYPARVLREVEAKRKILRDYEMWRALADQEPKGVLSAAGAAAGALRPAVCAIATIDSDHPDYREDWG